VVVRRDQLADVVDLCRKREDAEVGYIAAYRAGRSVIEVSNLTAVLAAKGLVVDG
jgi:4-hydroxy-4-methyl-2-oxoglutarate aldolase